MTSGWVGIKKYQQVMQEGTLAGVTLCASWDGLYLSFAHVQVSVVAAGVSCLCRILWVVSSRL